MSNRARDLRYGRRGGRWLDEPAPGVQSESMTDAEVMSMARAILMIAATFPGTRVLSTTRRVRAAAEALSRSQWMREAI